MTDPTPHPPTHPSTLPSTNDVEPPPVLGSWPRLYGAVLAHLAFWIVLLLVFTSRFNST